MEALSSLHRPPKTALAQHFECGSAQLLFGTHMHLRKYHALQTDL
jgi:hypothetical protein